MKSEKKEMAALGPFAGSFGMFAPAVEYMMDATQRSVLFLDVMRERGNQYRDHLKKTAPHVLEYDVELIVDGRTLERPVNYALVRVIPPANVEIDLKRSRLWLWIRAPDTVRALAALRPTAKSALPSKPAIPATSSGFSPIRCRVRQSGTLHAPRPYFLKRSLPFIRRPTASRV